MARKPILNPMLTLQSQPQPRQGQGGGKSQKDIRFDQFEERRQNLIGTLTALPERPAFRASARSGRTLLLIQMESGTIAPSLAPRDLFSETLDAGLVAPWKEGYVAEVDPGAIARILDRLAIDNLTVGMRVDVSRTVAVSILAERIAEQDFAVLWSRAEKGRSGRFFYATPAPFRSVRAGLDVDGEIARLGGSKLFGSELRPTPRSAAVVAIDSSMAMLPPQTAAVDVVTAGEDETELGGLRRTPPVVMELDSIDRLRGLIASGTIVRWEPVRPITPKDVGKMEVPEAPLPDLSDAPIVGVIDGGLSSKRYRPAVAWEAPPLVSHEMAALDHGKHVSSLIVEAENWGNGLDIPPLPCRLGIVQALAKVASAPFNPDAFLHAVDAAMAAHRETKVWNISANLEEECDDYFVSALGNALSAIARRHGNLLVLTAGNCEPGDALKLAPPGDCEAAIVVAGRSHNSRGRVAGPCTNSRIGLGPEGMLKPDLSWFSTHLSPDGQILIGTSYAAPLVSRVAAHTFARIKDADADLVKAVLLGNTDLPAFSHALGYGSPSTQAMPWESGPGSVVLAWKANLHTGFRYYWQDIAIPHTMIDAGYLHGRFRLTAILDPTVNGSGAGNYFASRIEVGLQFYDPYKRKWDKLIGALPVETPEGVARSEDAKWQPTRSYDGRFIPKQMRLRKDGLQSKRLGADVLRVHARVFERDLFTADLRSLPPERLHAAAFVLTMQDTQGDPRTFDNFVQQMGNRVASAVIDQELEVTA